MSLNRTWTNISMSQCLKHFHYQLSVLITVSYIPYINVGYKLIKEGDNLKKKGLFRHGLPLPNNYFYLCIKIYINLPKQSKNNNS